MYIKMDERSLYITMYINAARLPKKLSRTKSQKTALHVPKM